LRLLSTSFLWFLPCLPVAVLALFPQLSCVHLLSVFHKFVFVCLFVFLNL
jgi:hypothetical protein